MLENTEKAMKKEQFREAFEIRSVHTKEYKIGMCCFPANYAALRRKSNKDCLA
jgi:hypothetical protein